MEQPARRRHRHHGRRLTAAARLAEDRDAIRIAAEALDVVLHPLQRRDQVLHADVRRACPLLAAQAGEMQEAEDVEPVIDGDDDDVFLLREIRAVVEQVVAGAGREAAAVHPHHDGPRAVVERRREHVDGEAVLALRRLAIQRRDDGRRLFAVGIHRRGPRDLEVILDARPRGRFLRRHEAVRAARRRAVRHAPELLHAVLEQAAHAAVLRLRRAADRREAPVLRRRRSA